MEVVIIRDYNVPYLGGMDSAGTKVYIDKRVPKTFTTSSGIEVDIDQFLALHEISEREIEDVTDLKYAEAHRVATKIEKLYVESHDIDWAEYSAFYAPYIKLCRESFTDVPHDLYLKPYIDQNDTEVLKKLHDLGVQGA